MDQPLQWGRRFASSLRRAEGRQGQALVEFALVLPVLVLLLFASVDFSRAFFTLQAVTHASREGARSGIVSGATTADVNGAVNTRLVSAGLTQTASVTVTGVDGAASGDPTTVTVSYPFQTLGGALIPGWSGTVTLSQTTVMRHE